MKKKQKKLLINLLKGLINLIILSSVIYVLMFTFLSISILVWEVIGYPGYSTQALFFIASVISSFKIGYELYKKKIKKWFEVLFLYIQ